MTSPVGPVTPVSATQPPLNAQNLVDPSQIGTTGSNTNSSQMGIDGLNSLIGPPPLKTFIYAPQVRIVIAHNGLEYDVSNDLVRGQSMRSENAAATFLFTLHNKGLRYTPSGQAPFFSRMDRIVVYMKKTSWLQVFSGYLDKVPYKQLYAGTVDFKATCTIKRLMHTWWDPALPQASSLLNQLATPEAFGGDPDGMGANDSGLGTILRNIMVNVGGWNTANIHIQNFPTAFLQFMMTQVAALQASDAPNVLGFQQMLQGSDTTPGPGAYAGANPNSGPAGPSAPTGVGAAGTGTAFYVSQIVAACDQRGLGPLVQDNTLSSALTQAGAVGEAGTNTMTNPGSQQAWQQVQQAGQSWQQANRNSDGAILGVACALAETGGGVAIRNLFNPAVSGSEAFPNDGPGTNGTSVGIFQQQNQGWGTLAQRMNPMQSAGMFFAGLINVSGWRNMDPGQAIQQVQMSGNAAGTQYDAAVTLATTLVQAWRTSQAGTASTVIPGGSITVGGTTVPAAASAVGAAAGGSGGAPSAIGSAITGAATVSPSPAAIASAVNPVRQAKPQPDSEGAINFARTCLGLPYIWGGTGPAGYDCSGLVSQAFKSIGVAVGRTTQDIAGTVGRVPTASVQRGDIVEPSSGHVILWMGDGTIIEAQQTGVPLHQIPNPYPQNQWYGVFRACANGGIDPTAPFNPPSTMGPGNPPGALDQVAGATGTGSSGSTEGIARNEFGYMFTNQFASSTAASFTGTKAFIEGQPLIQMVMAIASAGLRCWGSAPNGDFMAWYPDYWGLDGKPAVMLLADIELKDVHIDFSDEPLTTHVYINGDLSMQGGTGASQDATLSWLASAGVATVEQPWLYARLIAAAPGDIESASGQEIMQRFGVRPLQQTFAMAGTTQMEFLLACQVFMEQWAKQYQTTVQMTFMPELFPGMRVELPDRNLQVYVNAVNHTFDYETGFLTSVTISAPSSPQGRTLMSSVNTPVIASQELNTPGAAVAP
jgi:cell wall-associated NlpC family hydrolase